MEIVIIFGPPGAGKGTQANLMSKNLGLEHISTGELMRKEASKKTILGKKIKKLIDSGHFVSDELITEVIENILSRKNTRGLIFDGFPRTLEQAKLFEELIEEKKIRKVCLVNLEVHEHELVNRLLKRKSLEGRNDDNADTIKTRFETYEKKTLPILSYFNNKIKIFHIQGIGEIDNINKEILQNLNTFK